MKPKPIFVAALALIAVLVSIGFSTVTERIARPVDVVHARGHVGSCARTAAAAAQILARALVRLEKS